MPVFWAWYHSGMGMIVKVWNEESLKIIMICVYGLGEVDFQPNELPVNKLKLIGFLQYLCGNLSM
jgi:hypothetical protein